MVAGFRGSMKRGIMAAPLVGLPLGLIRLLSRPGNGEPNLEKIARTIHWAARRGRLKGNRTAIADDLIYRNDMLSDFALAEPTTLISWGWEWRGRRHRKMASSLPFGAMTRKARNSPPI